MKLIQALYPCDHSWDEVFYDGQIPVKNNIVDVPEGKEHWAMILMVERGFIELKEEQKAAPKKRAASVAKSSKETTHD